MYMRHLARLASIAPDAVPPNTSAYVVANARSLLANDACAEGGFGTDWRGPCLPGGTSVAATSAAVDLLLAAAQLSGARGGAWAEASSAATSPVPLGLGACVDASGAQMPACASPPGITEAACAAAAVADARAAGYDMYTPCSGAGAQCRVRTLGGESSCPAGWTFSPGVATSVVAGDGAALTVCVAVR